MSYNSVNVNLNLLKQRTCDEFIEWLKIKELKVDERYEFSKLFNDFKSVYCDDLFNSRTFSNWLKMFAISNDWAVQSKPSSGNTYYTFKKWPSAQYTLLTRGGMKIIYYPPPIKNIN